MTRELADHQDLKRCPFLPFSTNGFAARTRSPAERQRLETQAEADNRPNNRSTCFAYQRARPAGVRTPRALSASAIPFRLVIPAACSSFTMGATFAALSSARDWRAFRAAWRAAGGKRLARFDMSARDEFLVGTGSGPATEVC